MSRAAGSEATEVDKGHGRIEKRTLRTTPILTADGWPGRKLGIEIRRERTVKGETTVEVEYAITSWSTDAATLLKVIRDHWRIENPQPDCRQSDNLCEAGGTGYHRR